MSCQKCDAESSILFEYKEIKSVKGASVTYGRSESLCYNCYGSRVRAMKQKEKS